MKELFNPIRGQRGEFRVALNLSELGERAWELLSLAQGLGFETPQFKTYTRASGIVEIWAVLLQQFHSYEAFIEPIVSEWDDAIDQMHQAIGRDSYLHLIVLCNFREYLELEVA
jgi:hypothetical protein